MNTLLIIAFIKALDGFGTFWFIDSLRCTMMHARCTIVSQASQRRVVPAGSHQVAFFACHDLCPDFCGAAKHLLNKKWHGLRRQRAQRARRANFNVRKKQKPCLQGRVLQKVTKSLSRKLQKHWWSGSLHARRPRNLLRMFEGDNMWQQIRKSGLFRICPLCSVATTGPPPTGNGSTCQSMPKWGATSMGVQCHKTPQVKICTEQTTNCTADVASSCGNDEVDDNSPGPPWATTLVPCTQCNRFVYCTCHTFRTYLPLAAAVASAGLRLPRCSNTPWLPWSCKEDM